MRELSLALNKATGHHTPTPALAPPTPGLMPAPTGPQEIDRRMQLEMDGDVDLHMQRAAQHTRTAPPRGGRGTGGRVGGLDALFLGLPRSDPGSQRQVLAT